MRNEDRDADYRDQQDPWDRGTYQTGCTRPPKSRGGLIALLLILVIFLGGVTSALGILNIRLFRQINDTQEQEGEVPVAFSNTDYTEESETVAAATEPGTVKQSGDMDLNLSQSPASVANIPLEGGLSLQEIYRKAIPSVVSISCSTDSGSSSGTGVVLSADGYIVTNCHVVEDARYIEARFTDGRMLTASVVGTDAISDLAVLVVQADDLTPAEFGDASVLQVGDVVVAIGDPLGVELRGTMTDGIVSAINREVTVSGRTMTLIQTNAALNSGNSGGPLLNCYGQVIGINTMKIGDYMSAAGVEGLGFAIPSTTVKEIVDQLASQGYVSGRPTLGISGETVSSFYQLYYRLPEGLYITEVAEGSDAEVQGIQPGDILLQLGDTRVKGPDDLATLLYGLEVGEAVDVIIYRSGRQYSVTLTVGEANG